MEKEKIGIALGSGAARGLAHIGVLDVLQKEGIPIHIVAGTSAGALVGALYAYGKDIEEIKSIALNLKAPKLVSLIDPSIPKSGFITGRNVKRLLSSNFNGNIQFDEMKLPFACVATDIETGEEIVFDHGSVLQALRASISIPGIFTVARWQGRHLVDGALVNPIPVDIVLRMGADFVIAVNVIPEASLESQRIAREQKDALKEIRIVQQVSSLVERLVNDQTDKLRQPKIIREISALVQKLTEQEGYSARTLKFIQGITQDIEISTKKQTTNLGKNRIVKRVSGRIQQLQVERRATLREPNIIDVLMQSLNISAYSLVRTSLRSADIVISPQVGHVAVGDFLKGQECLEQGKLAASAVVPEIKRRLKIE